MLTTFSLHQRRSHHILTTFSLLQRRLHHMLTTFSLLQRRSHHMLTTFSLRQRRSHHMLTTFSLPPTSPYKYYDKCCSTSFNLENLTCEHFLLKAKDTPRKICVFYTVYVVFFSQSNLLPLDVSGSSNSEFCTEFMFTVSLLKQERVSEKLALVSILISLYVTKTQ